MLINDRYDCYGLFFLLLVNVHSTLTEMGEKRP